MSIECPANQVLKLSYTLYPSPLQAHKVNMITPALQLMK